MSGNKTEQKENKQDDEDITITEMENGIVYEGTFDGVRPPAPGFPIYAFRLKLDNGNIKFLLVHFEEFRRCCKALDLQKGDRIRVRKTEEDWEVWKLG